MRTIISLACVAVILSGLTGCRSPRSEPKDLLAVETQNRPPRTESNDSSAIDFEKELLTVDFEAETTLRYRLTSERTLQITLDSADPKSKKSKPHKTTEKLTLVIAYKPIDIDPYGLTTIEGRCESAEVRRVTFLGKTKKSDAVEALAGQSFQFQITPTGRIDDYSQLKALTRKLGDKAFVSGTRQRQRVKNPDMIYDFVALQWYLWDSIASVKNPLDGVAVGQSWKSNQHVPLPVPLRAVREVTYTVDEIKETPTGRKAVISSSYALSNAKPGNWTIPYSGKFGFKGSILALLRNYKYKWLKGTGREVFNIDRGVLQSRTEQYQIEIGADLLLPLGDSKPKLKVEQKISIKLLEG